MSRIFILAVVISLLVPGLSAEPSIESRSGQDVLAKYLENNREQRLALRDVSMVVDIKADLPNLQKSGVLQALRKVSALGKITYKVLGFRGDDMVKRDVIARYIQAEVKTSDSRTRDALAINADNYKFVYYGKYGSGDWVLHLFELKPKSKRLGMYKGWLWIDAKSGMPVRESGRLVKNPSMFLKRVDFVKDYEMVDGVPVPSKIESEIKTRLVGTARIFINFKNISFHKEAPRIAASNLVETQ